MLLLLLLPLSLALDLARATQAPLPVTHNPRGWQAAQHAFARPEHTAQPERVPSTQAKSQVERTSRQQAEEAEFVPTDTHSPYMGHTSQSGHSLALTCLLVLCGYVIGYRISSSSLQNKLQLVVLESKAVAEDQQQQHQQSLPAAPGQPGLLTNKSVAQPSDLVQASSNTTHISKSYTAAVSPSMPDVAAANSDPPDQQQTSQTSPLNIDMPSPESCSSVLAPAGQSVRCAAAAASIPAAASSVGSGTEEDDRVIVSRAEQEDTANSPAASSQKALQASSIAPDVGQLEAVCATPAARPRLQQQHYTVESPASASTALLDHPDLDTAAALVMAVHSHLEARGVPASQRAQFTGNVLNAIEIQQRQQHHEVSSGYALSCSDARLGPARSFVTLLPSWTQRYSGHSFALLDFKLHLRPPTRISCHS